jgi:hypothetical protein
LTLDHKTRRPKVANGTEEPWTAEVRDTAALADDPE